MLFGSDAELWVQVLIGRLSLAVQRWEGLEENRKIERKRQERNRSEPKKDNPQPNGGLGWLPLKVTFRVE